MSNFLLTLKNFFTTESGTIFLIESIILTVAFILCLGFSIFRVGYSIKHRVWFFFTASGVVCAEFGASILVGRFGTGFIMLFIALVYFSIVISIRTLPDKATDKQKDFVKYLNESIYRAEKPVERGARKDGDADKENNVLKFIKNDGRNSLVPPRNIEKKKCEISHASAGVQGDNGHSDALDETQEIKDVDFSHVKNVIDRLSYFNLTSNDRRQIKELELSLIDAETNGYTIDVKEKINAGLGSLLKIMSKYGA
ncbi:MAG: hypothetical protein IJZ73_02255 [Clostridia bacterium]|nr:hypothetical protein [Clostridia bacterium]